MRPPLMPLIVSDVMEFKLSRGRDLSHVIPVGGSHDLCARSMLKVFEPYRIGVASL
jgi:hypothetical protein